MFQEFVATRALKPTATAAHSGAKFWPPSALTFAQKAQPAQVSASTARSAVSRDIVGEVQEIAQIVLGSPVAHNASFTEAGLFSLGAPHQPPLPPGSLIKMAPRRPEPASVPSVS